MQIDENKSKLLAAQSKYKELTNQQVAVRGKQERAAHELDQLQFELVSAEKSAKLLEKAVIRGESNEADLRKLQKTLSAINERIDQSQKSQRLMAEVIRDLDREISDSIDAVRHATTKFCQSVHAETVAKLGPEVRQTLLEAFAALRMASASSIHGDLPWAQFLFETFAEPNAIVTLETINSFKAKRGI